MLISLLQKFSSIHFSTHSHSPLSHRRYAFFSLILTSFKQWLCHHFCQHRCTISRKFWNKQAFSKIHQWKLNKQRRTSYNNNGARTSTYPWLKAYTMKQAGKQANRQTIRRKMKNIIKHCVILCDSELWIILFMVIILFCVHSLFFIVWIGFLGGAVVAATAADAIR